MLTTYSNETSYVITGQTNHPHKICKSPDLEIFDIINLYILNRENININFVFCVCVCVCVTTLQLFIKCKRSNESIMLSQKEITSLTD